MTGITKTDITNRLKGLEKIGYKVFTFNSNRAMPSGSKGFVDHVLVGHGLNYMIEVKIGKDKLSAEQKKTQKLFSQCNNYFIITENNLDQIIDYILWKHNDRENTQVQS